MADIAERLKKKLQEEIAQLDHELGADRERVGATVLIAVTLVRIARTLKIGLRARCSIMSSTQTCPKSS